MNTLRRITLTATAVFALVCAQFAHAQCVSLTTLGSAYTQNFDTLSNTAGSTTNNLTIPGWFMTETGGGARDNEQYAVDTGASTTGDTYSYGSAAATDRALGQLRSGTLIPNFGACFTNNTGSTITSLAVAYNGEEWRLGTAARTDQMNFEYSLNATDLVTGTWTNVAALNFVTPDTATTGAKNGNAAADRTALSSTISSLSIANGATFWIRWNDQDASGADDGLAVDDFSLTPTSAPVNNPPAITPPSNPITSVAQDAAPFTVNLSGTDDGNVFSWSATPGTGVSNVSVTGGQGTSTVTYTVTLTAGFNGDAQFTATLSDTVNTPVNQLVHITVIPPPAQVTGLAASAGTSHVQLTWTTASGATTYNVKRSTASGTETTIASPATNSYDDTTTTDGTQYFYVVSGVGAGGEGLNSSEVTATSMAAPTGLATTPGNAHVQLNWGAVAGATGYDVQRSTTSGSGYSSIATPATNSYDDTAVTNGTPYYYIVKATNANGVSNASSEASGTPAAPGKIVISQLYGGAGCGTAGCSAYKNDYIEIFNSGGTAVNVNGWSVQYASATGTTTWQVTNLPNVSIQPGEYFLVAESAGANGVLNVPTPDVTGTIAMAATAGKVAVLNTTTALSGACPASASIQDLVGYGTTANCNEGGANAAAPSTANADIRNSQGCTDTNNNASDFTAAAAAPRNSATPFHVCGVVVNNPPAITPPSNPITTVTQDAAPFTVSLSGTDDNNVFNWSATPGTGVSSVNVTGGQGTSTVTYTVSLVAAFNGDAQFTATLTDNVNTPVNQLVHITVNPPAPPAAPTGLNATPGDSHVQLTWNSVSGATSYNVKRSTTSGAETTIASPATNSYNDTTAVNGTPYFYVVSAVGAGGEGANSSEVTATPNAVTAVPAGLKAVVTSGNVALSWNAVGGATSYNLKRSLTAGGPYSTINSPSGTTYNDSAVTNGTRYFYVVSAVAPVTGESANSAEVHAKPDLPENLGIVISQVYGAGGNAGATLTNDYIELFNRGNSTVDINGWSVQYSSAAGSTWTPTALNGTIAPGQHYLIGEGAGAGGTTPLPTPDASGAIGMSGTAGKVLLSSSASAQTGGCPTGVLDFVGYGSGPTCFEGSGPTPSLGGNVNSATRGSNGCVDTNNNASDFTAVTAAPRNTAAAFTPCTLSPIGYATPGTVTNGGSVLLRVELPPSATAASVSADLSSIGGGASQSFFDNGTNGDITAGDNIFSFQTTATSSAGVKSLPVSANGNATAASTTIQLTILPPLETIAAVKADTTPADTIPDRLNQPVLVRGVVTSVDFRGGTGIEYYIQDPTAGIDVFSTSDFGPFTVGTNVEVSGTVTQFNGLTEITPNTITTLPGGTLPAVTPQTVTLSQLVDGSGEPLEGTLVRVDNLTVTSGTFPAAGADGNVTVSDGVTSGTLRVDKDTDIAGTTAPGGIFSVIALVGQSDASAPFDCCYQLLPRSTADIIPRTPPGGSGNSNPPAVPPGGTTLLSVSVTLGQNPPSTGLNVVADLSAIGLSASQQFYDDGTHGDVSPGDQIWSYQATVDNATSLGSKSMPATVSDAQARSSIVNIPLFVQNASAPPPPANLAATPGNAQVGLTWDPSAGATNYNVKRSTVSGGPYTTVAPGVATNSYTDTTVNNGTRYYYVVSALSGANESGDSSEATALPTAPPPSGSLAKIYFVDIGQGASTLIVSPSGKSMLVDGGPGGAATTELTTTLNAALGPSGKIDYLVLTHYHVDHDAGLTDIINAGRVSPTGIAYDNGDGANVVPPVPTNSTGTAYTAYKNALSAHGITRQTAVPGTTIDLGSGVRATFMAAGGQLMSGGHVWVSGTDLNSTSVSTLVEFNNFDFLISGDLTGGGQTTTAKTPDVETFVGQMVRDVDFVQLDHHGSTTASGRRFLAQLKAEASLASAGATNTFGHPNRETANKYLNTPATSGNTYGGTGLPNPGNGPVFYQTDPSPATDNRTTTQGYSGADQAHAGLGTILLKTDGLVSFSMESFDDGGVRLAPNAHVYALDGQGNGLASDFPPTVIPNLTPGVPTAADTVTVTALVNDVQPITSVTLNYSLNGAAQAPVTMTNTTGSEYAATIPPQTDGTRVDYTVTAVANGLSTSYAGGYFSGTTTIATLRSLNALGEPTYLDYAARISGLCTSGTGNYSSTNNDDYITDATGALNVSRTIDPSVPATTPTVTGNTYTVAGFINQLNGKFRLDVTPPFDGVDKPWATTTGSFNPYSITSTGSGAVTPITRTIAQILADGEGNEAKLVSIANCTVTSGTIPASGGTDAFLNVTDGTGTIEMKIDGDSQIFGAATPSGTFTLVGIVQQDDFFRPFDSRYDVAPRTAADFGGTATQALITIAEARADIDPTTGNSPDDYVPDRLGQKVKIRGVVTSVDFRGATGTEVYIQDPTAGVDIFSTSINTTLNMGDNIEVTGTVSQFNGLTEIVPSSASDITILSPGTLPNPVMEVVTCAQLGNSGAGERFEGKLVRINNVTLTAPPATFGANTNYNITDGTDTIQIRIDSDTDIDGTAPPAGTFSIIGVLGQFDSTAPFDSGYQLFPRVRATDFLPAVPAAAAINATSGTPQSASINTAFATAMQATVTDGGSNPIDGIGVTFTAPGSGASGTFPSNLNTITVPTNASGVATAPTFTANNAVGGYTVTATTGALTANFSLTNVSNAATHFSVTAPATVTNGTSFSVTVTALTSSEATATSYTGTVHFTSTSSGTLPADYTFLPADAGVKTFNVTLTTNGAQSVTATDTIAGTITGSANLTVNPLPATHFSVTAPATVTNGIAFNVTVTALDASNATVTGYTGTATFSSSSTGTLPSDYTFTGGDAGTKTFSVTLTTNGAQSVTATDTVTASITGTANTTVNPCNLPPTPTISGDTNGTGTQDQACPEVPLTLHANGATGATSYQWYKDIDLLSGETNATYQATGSATYYVTATNICGTTVQSAGYVVQNPTPHAPFISFRGQSSSTTSLSICQGQSQIIDSDSATGIQWWKDGAPIPGANSQSYTATQSGTYTAQLNALGCHSQFGRDVVLTVNPTPDATITAPAALVGLSTGNSASVANAGGGATYNWSITNGTITAGTGTNSITFTAGATGPITLQVTVTNSSNCSDTKSASVNVSAAPATHLSVSAPASVTAGTPFSITVTALDASNATAPSYTGTVHFTSSAAGTLPADYTFVAGDNGVKTFNVTLTSTGSQSITATDTVTASITGSTNTTVNQAAATHFQVTAPASVTNGTAFSVTVTALNASNATATNYAGTIHFTSSSSGTLPADYTFLPGDNGTKTFSVTLTTNGTQSISVSDGSINGSTNTNVTCPALSVTASNNGPVCAPATVNLTATTGATGVTFSWSGPGGYTSTQQNPTGISVAGTYTVTMTFNGCTATSSTNVVITPQPSATITAPTGVCASSSYNASAPAGATTYNWSITNGVITAGNGTSSITFTSGASGTTTLSLSVSNGSCSNSSSKSMAIAPPPNATMPPKVEICGPGLITIPVTLTGTAPFTINWSDGFVQSGISGHTASRTINILVNRTLSITGVTDASCGVNFATKTVSLQIDSAIVINTPPTDQHVANGASATFTVNASGGNLHYQWYAGNVGDTSNPVGIDQPSYTTGPVHGIDKYWLRISNACGSVDSAQVIATNSNTHRRASGH